MSQIYNGNTKRPKPKENQVGILGISAKEFRHFAGNSVECLWSRKEHCNGYTSMRPKKLPHLPSKNCRNFIKWFKEGHSWIIVP